MLIEKEIHSRKYENHYNDYLSDDAFTLIELVIAISLAAMIVLITAVIFKQASTAFSDSDARNEVYQNARVAFDILKRDISGAVLNANYELFKSFNNINANDYLTISAKGGSDILTLLSSTPNLEDKPIALITYFLSTNNILSKDEITADSTLNTSISNFNPDTATGYQLGFNVSTLQFRYRDADGAWIDTWDSTTKGYLPNTVEVKVTISDMSNRFSSEFTRMVSIP